MANRLAMDKSQAIKSLATSGMSERRIARTLGVSRKAVRAHLGDEAPKEEMEWRAGWKTCPTASAWLRTTVSAGAAALP
jgi:predicted ArsR family transcriptional regulator